MAWEEGGRVGKVLGWLQPSCLPPFQLLPLLFADWKSLCELPGFSKANRRVEDNVLQTAPSPASVSSSEMPQLGEKPSMEPQDRCGAGGSEAEEAVAGAADTAWAFLSGGPWMNLTSSVGSSFHVCAVGLIIPAYWFPPV